MSVPPFPTSGWWHGAALGCGSRFGRYCETAAGERRWCDGFFRGSSYHSRTELSPTLSWLAISVSISVSRSVTVSVAKSLSAFVPSCLCLPLQPPLPHPLRIHTLHPPSCPFPWSLLHPAPSPLPSTHIPCFPHTPSFASVRWERASSGIF